MINIAGDTHPGRVRENNEDSIFMDEERGLAVVADGMGGHASGEIASRITVDTFAHERNEDLAQVLLLAHRNIVDHALANPECAGMGATAVAVRADAKSYQVCWVGDSRAYHWRPGKGLRQVSRDHSYLELLLSQGQISEKEARKHPQRNVVTQALGVGEPEPETVRIEWAAGDRLLLCSDGLSDELGDAEIGEQLAEGAALTATAEKLIAAALKKAGRDNVSVLLMENHFSTSSPSGWKNALKRFFPDNLHWFSRR